MLSVIIPVLDEAENLPQLHRELSATAGVEGYALQMIFVDDGSTDGTWAVIERLAAEDSRVLGIRFRRNFGKAAAFNAGFNAAEGDRIVTIDGDLQDDPAEIPRSAGEARRRLRRGERLEKSPARSVAQGAAVAGLQLAGQQARPASCCTITIAASSASAAR